MKRAIHPVAKKHGYKSNEDFYNDFPTKEHYDQYCAKMAAGGTIDQWNAAHPEQALTRPIADYQQEFTTTPLGRSKVDNYGSVNPATGLPLTAQDKTNWNAFHRDQAYNNPEYGTDALNHNGKTGSQTTASSFGQYQYDHFDGKPYTDANGVFQPRGKNIGHLDPSVTPMTNDQLNSWTVDNRANQWTSNSQGVGIDGTRSAVAPTQAPVKPLGISSNGFPTREEAIAKYKAKTRPVSNEPDSDYSIDTLRASTSQDLAQYNNKQYDMSGNEMARGGRVRRIKKMGDGDLTGPNPPGVDPMDMTGRPDNNWNPDPSNPPPAMGPIPQDNLKGMGDYAQAHPGPSSKPRGRNEFGVGMDLNLNTSNLINGADMAVTNYMYNPQVRAMEANNMRANMQRSVSPNDFNGSDMLTYSQGGNIVDQYTTQPGLAKEEIEGGEGVQFPDGTFDMAQGPSHAQGGIPTNLPESTKVFSKRSYAEKEFVSDITGGKIKKKMKHADLADRFNSEKEEKALALVKKRKDPIAERSLNATIAWKTAARDAVFNHQEMMKDPDGAVMEMASGGRVRKMDPGGAALGPSPYDPWRQVAPDMPDPLPSASPDYPIAGAVNMDPYQSPVPEHDPVTDDYLALEPTAGGPTNHSGYTNVDIRRNAYAPPTNTTAPKGKRKILSLDQIPTSDLLPSSVAAINAITRRPILSGKFNPSYGGRPVEMNIDPLLNRNLSLGKPGMTGNSGNASIDQARALATLGSVQEADNQAYMSKFNADTLGRKQWQDEVAQSKNQAEAYNLGQRERTDAKMDTRFANEQAAFQSIANNAYTNSRKKLYDERAQKLAQEFSPNYHYDPKTGFTFVQGADGQWHAVQIGGANASFAKGDGLRGSERSVYDSKTGTWKKTRTMREDYSDNA